MLTALNKYDKHSVKYFEVLSEHDFFCVMTKLTIKCYRENVFPARNRTPAPSIGTFDPTLDEHCNVIACDFAGILLTF